MEVNSYVLEVLVRERLAEMRARGERSNRVREARGDANSLRCVLGDALIRMGQRLHGAGALLRRPVLRDVFQDVRRKNAADRTLTFTVATHVLFPPSDRRGPTPLGYVGPARGRVVMEATPRFVGARRSWRLIRTAPSGRRRRARRTTPALGPECSRG